MFKQFIKSSLLILVNLFLIVIFWIPIYVYCFIYYKGMQRFAKKHASLLHKWEDVEIFPPNSIGWCNNCGKTLYNQEIYSTMEQFNGDEFKICHNCIEKTVVNILNNDIYFIAQVYCQIQRMKTLNRKIREVVNKYQ